PTDGDSWILAQNNLFAKTALVSGVSGFSGEPADVTGQWIWTKDADGFKNAPTGACYFRKTFPLASSEADAIQSGKSQALLSIIADDDYTCWLNGDLVAQGGLSCGRVCVFDVTKQLRKGDNVLAVRASNITGPAGLLAQLTYRAAIDAKPAVLVCTNATW